MGASISECEHEYHLFVPDKDFARPSDLDYSDPYKYSHAMTERPTLQPLLTSWKSGLKAPYRGVTSDGNLKEFLYELRDEDVPVQRMTRAADAILEALDQDERQKIMHDLDSENWRQWSNPEFMIFSNGLRLEHLERQKLDLILELIEASLSKQGYKKVRAAMKTNKYLGVLCSLQGILNEFSYNFTIYGAPSVSEPWGFSITGHHLCLNVFVIGQQMVIGPVFLGAEPCVIDGGPDAGTELLRVEESLGLLLMQSLSPGLKEKAQIYKQLHDPAMPKGRWNPADQRHLAGAFQDNRIIPYEGILASEMTEDQQDLLMSVISSFLVLYPTQSYECRYQEVRQFLKETYFSWIGGFGDKDAFYYRIQSPVALFEFDHHSGVFLTNEEPAKYHIHTIQRLPNGNDYGRAVIALSRKFKKN